MSKYTARNHWLDRDETADTMLEIMKETHVFSATKTYNGVFYFQEECDQYFCVELTKEQLLALAEELRELAESA